MIKLGMLINDRYEIVEKIGTGGMSDVYKAKDLKLNRYVAVKVLKQEFCENKNFVSKFRVEAQAAAGLMHPNIVNVYDVGEEDSIHYIVMELVEGITLKKYIEKKIRLTTKEAISIAIQVAMGIEAAHNNHIIHRDIKPQNIIISKEGKVKVTDFGIAKAATSNTITSNAMGSVHYSSPEQARGGFSDEKSDIYSLGITLFEMLTGRVPFSGDTTVAIAIKHIQDEMPSPRQFAPDIPVSVEGIVMKCTQKNPDRRYQNMADIIKDLKHSLINPDEDFVEKNNIDEGGKTRIAPQTNSKALRKEEYAVDDTKQQPSVEDTQSSDFAVNPKPKQVNKNTNNNKNSGNKNTSNKNTNNKNKAKSQGTETAKTSKSKSNAQNQDALEKKKKVSKDKKDIYDTRSFDDDYSYNPKVDKILTYVTVAGFVIIGCIILFLAGKTFGLISSDNDNNPSQQATQDKAERAVMPEFVGKNAEIIKEELNKVNLGCRLEYVESVDYAKDLVVSAQLESGEEVRKGDKILLHTTIVLSVSAGADGIKVPEVIGLSEAEGTSKLTKEGFKVNKEDRFSDEFKKGTIIEQSVKGGDLASIESTITIVISKGAENIEVRIPELLGKTLEAATSTLEAEGLIVGEVEESYSTEYANGLICYQSFTTGSTVSQGTKVDLKVSIGSEITTYGCNLVIQAPTDYVGGNAEVILTTADDSYKQLWYNQNVTAFPVAINLSGFESASSYGIVTISYIRNVEVLVKDSDGNQTTAINQELAQVKQNVEFTKE